MPLGCFPIVVVLSNVYGLNSLLSLGVVPRTPAAEPGILPVFPAAIALGRDGPRARLPDDGHHVDGSADRRRHRDRL